MDHFSLAYMGYSTIKKRALFNDDHNFFHILIIAVDSVGLVFASSYCTNFIIENINIDYY